MRWTALLGTHRETDRGSHILTTSGDILASYHDVQKSPVITDKLSTFGQVIFYLRVDTLSVSSMAVI